MKIAICASEGAPYAKSGGLGDVMEALPLRFSASRATKSRCSCRISSRAFTGSTAHGSTPVHRLLRF